MSDADAPIPAPKDWRQLDYEARRRAWRVMADAWLRERELPGTPRTIIKGGDPA